MPHLLLHQQPGSAQTPEGTLSPASHLRPGSYHTMSGKRRGGARPTMLMRLEVLRQYLRLVKP
eukprot:77303-Pleurochrysis_carterae.AAC.1